MVRPVQSYCILWGNAGGKTLQEVRTEKRPPDRRNKNRKKTYLTLTWQPSWPSTVAEAQPTRAKRSPSTSASRQRRVAARAIAVASSLPASSTPTPPDAPRRRPAPPAPLSSLPGPLSLLCSLPTTPPNMPIAAVRRCREHHRPDDAPSCSRAPLPRHQPPHRAT